MKKHILVILCVLFTVSTVHAQVKRPTIMVVPSDVWCNANQYVSEFESQGVTQLIPDYRRALQTNADLLSVINKINILMADRGFPLKNLESVLKSIDQNRAEESLLMSKNTGSSVAENPIDELRRTARADIILSLTWTLNTVGPKKSVTYTLQALDAYTNVQIAGTQGTGEPSFACEVPVLLEEAVSVHMGELTDQLQTYFEDLAAYGRSVNIDIRVFENMDDIDLETEYDGVELMEIIDKWVSDNTVGHAFNKLEASETRISYEQVRIPLYRTNGMGMDAEYFVRDLRKFLKNPPYNLTSKVMASGLGKAMLIIGDK